MYSRRRFFGLLGGTALAGAATFNAGKSPVTFASTGTRPVDSSVSDAPAAQLLFRIENRGGFVSVEYTLTELPLVSVYADGRVITPGPMLLIYPPPALPNLTQTVITDAGIATVIKHARAAGLFDGSVHYEGPEISDLPDTVFITNVGRVSTEVSAYGLGGDESMLPDSADAEARAKLIEFQSFLTNLPGNLPPGQIRIAEMEYRIRRIKIYAREIDPANPPWEDPSMPPPELRWPLAMPISQFAALSEGAYAGLSCGVFTGRDASRLVRALQDANQLTPWRSEGKLYQLWVRPLLPDEPATC